MPFYAYRCSKCDKSFEIAAPMADSAKPRKCECGAKAVRDIQAEHGRGNVDGLIKDNIRWSWSLGVDPRQIPEAMKLHPGAEFNKLKEAKIFEY